MRVTNTAVLIWMVLAGSVSAGDLDLTDKQVKTSYSIGYQVGGDFLRQGKDINPELVVQGVMDALEGRQALIPAGEMSAILVDLQKEITEAQRREVLDLAKRNLETGRNFLEKNGKAVGVKTLPSGLQYRVLTTGTGNIPRASDTVRVHYRGSLLDGTEFDSSYKKGKPATFKVDGVITGWTEALQLMKEGGRWQLFIPPELAYRDSRSGPIEPNSTLIYEVQLLSIEEN